MLQQLHTQTECLLYLEKLRWNHKVICPYCSSAKTHPAKNEQGRHFCYSCIKSFSVLVATIFEDTRLPLPQWMMVIQQMLKSNQIISSASLAAGVGTTVKTAWLTAMKVRCAMIDTDYDGIQSKTIGIRQSFKGINELLPMKLITLLKQHIKYDKNNSLAIIRSCETQDRETAILPGIYAQQNGTDEKQSFGHIHGAFVKTSIRPYGKSPDAKYLPFYLLEYEYKLRRRNLKKSLFPEFMKHIFHGHTLSLLANDAVKKQDVRA